jgi:hypothetical protein
VKRVQRITLALAAVFALVAITGASSAAAFETTVCNTSATAPYCESGTGYPASTAVEVKAPTATITGGIGTLTCGETTIKGTLASQQASPLPLTVTSMSLPACAVNKSAYKCNATTTEGKANLTWTEGSNGTLSSESAGFREDCPVFGVNCTYSPVAGLPVHGGNPGTITATKVALAPTSNPKLCTKGSVEITANFEITTPKPFYVSKVGVPNGTQLCSVEGFSICPEKYAYKAGSMISAESTDFKIATSISTITCKKSTMTATTQEHLGGEPLPLGSLKHTLQECFFPGVGACTATANESTGSIEFIQGFGGAYRLKTLWDFSCGAGAVHCEWNSEGLVGVVHGSNEFPPATISMGHQPLHYVGGSVCPTFAEISFNYTIAYPTPIYLTS